MVPINLLCQFTQHHVMGLSHIYMPQMNDESVDGAVALGKVETQRDDVRYVTKASEDDEEDDEDEVSSHCF